MTLKEIDRTRALSRLRTDMRASFDEAATVAGADRKGLPGSRTINSAPGCFAAPTSLPRAL